MSATRIPRRGRTGVYLLPPAWEAAIEGWCAWLTAGGKSTRTIYLRRSSVRTIARRSGTEGPSEITGTCLVDMFGGYAYSLEARRSIRTSAVSFFGWCVTRGHAEHNPASELPEIPNSQPRPRPAPDDVWRDLIATAPPRELVMIRLAGEAGLRRGEVAKVHRDDLIHGPRGYSLIVHGKGGKQRVVPVSDSLGALIREGSVGHSPHLARSASEPAPRGRGASRSTGHLFPGDHDGHLSERYVGELISALMPPSLTMHCLRHLFATRAYRGSRNLRAVQVLLGHSSVSTTERYCAVDDDEIRAAMMSAGTQ